MKKFEAGATVHQGVTQVLRFCISFLPNSLKGYVSIVFSHAGQVHSLKKILSWLYLTNRKV